MAVYPFAASPAPDQAPAQQYGTTPSTLLALDMAISNRNNAHVDICVIGDSITEGQGSTAFANRWVQQANRAIRARYPTTALGSAGGLGYIPALGTGTNTFAWPLTVTGNFIAGDLGPTRNNVFAAAACTIAWTAPAGTTSIRIMYFDGGNGVFSWAKNGGAATNVTGTSLFKEILTASIPMTGGDTLAVLWVSGSIFVDGIVHYAGDESSGITIHGCGHSGWGTKDWNAAEQFALNWAQCYANGFPGIAAVAMMLGANDANTGGDNLTAAAFQAGLGTLASTVRTSTAALATIPMPVIAEYPVNFTLNDPGGWPAYVTAARNAAASSVAPSRVTDLTYRMPAVAGVPAAYAGLYADPAPGHPTNLGAALIGEIVAAGFKVA